MAPKKKAKKTKKAPKAGKAAKRKAGARPKKAAPKKAAAGKAAPKKAARKKAAKTARPAPAPLPWRVPLEGEGRIGEVEDYFGHIGVIALKLEKPLAVGERIHVRGHTTDLTQSVDSIQIEHRAVQSASPGDSVGIKVSDKCRKGDWVYRAP